jgi:hypothetical protein
MPTIYHYCDANAFLSIIQNDALWLSSLYSMNDTGELKYFLDKVLPIVQKRISVCRSGQGFDFFAQTYRTDYYGVCFSTEQDDLYQWQSYGQKGKGFAIGFDSDTLCPFKPASFALAGLLDRIGGPEKNVGHQLGLASVQYMDAEKIDVCARRVEELVYLEMNGMVHSIESIVSVINIISSTIKNDRFKAEKECRLLYAPKIHDPHELNQMGTIGGPLTERKWRYGPHGLTPYFEYKDVRRHIREVILGPNCTEIGGEHMEDFLRTHGMNIEVKRSQTTLR